MPDFKIKFVVYGMSAKTLATAVALLSLSPVTSLNRKENIQQNAEEKIQEFSLLKDSARFPSYTAGSVYRPFSHALRNELKKVPHRVDTVDFCPQLVDKNYVSQNLGYFDAENRQITIHHFRDAGFFEDDFLYVKRLNAPDSKEAVLAHEYRHAVNSRYDRTNLSLRDYAQSLRDDEISGCIASLLLKREKFLDNGDFRFLEGEPEAEYYAEAVKAGLFYPQYGKMSRMEQRVLIIAGSKIWEQSRSAGYDKAFRERIAQYAEQKSYAELSADTEAEYKKLCSHYYTFKFDGTKIDLSKERNRPLPLNDETDNYVKILLFKAKVRDLSSSARRHLDRFASRILER
ncbi:MAG: hypothetical protein J6L86_05975 [Alphaproteobacteria bacterium]|nr:hypothetical protein [Alphaproteobacteria bacterium]